MNAIDFFDRGWLLGAAAPCLIDGVSGGMKTYGQVRSTTLQVAHRLHQQGCGLGSKVAVLSNNHSAAFAVVLGIIRAGVTWIPVNPRTAIEEIGRVLDAFDCEVLFFHSDFGSAVEPIAKRAPKIRSFVCIDSDEFQHPSLDVWLDGTEEAELVLPHDPERGFTLQPTGGTTGMPKGVSLPCRALENMVANLAASLPRQGRPIFLAVAPLTHAAGMVAQYVLAFGGSLIIFPRVDKNELLRSIPKFGVSHIFLPPTVIYDLLAHPEVREIDYSSLQGFIYGAAPIAPQKLREALEVFGPVMCQVYGQTETSMPSTFLAPGDHFENGQIASDQRLSSCGRQTPFTKVEVQDDDGKPVPPGQVGEICVTGQGLMTGYYKNPEATAEAFRDGWIRTGDVGYRDTEGYFYITDRRKDMIVTGGFNVYSVEVERALLEHPAVHECAVIGVPDPKWGERVTAFVELHPGVSVETNDLIAFCKQKIGSVQAPKDIYRIDCLPRSSVGKVLKRELRKRFWDPNGRAVS
ncbi:fatty-acyl-CoA synthase [Bradyrhizobium diazoefficiens]